MTALAIADAEGFEAVSMRRIAEDLDAGTMTLYHYIRTKDDLLALMDDQLMAETLVPAAELPADWREALVEIARRSRAVFQRHSWALHSMQGSRLGPHGLRHIEQSMAAVSSAPLDDASKVALCGMLDDFVFGFVLRNAEAPPLDAWLDPPAVHALDDLVSAQVATGEYPHLARFIGRDKPSVAFERAARWMTDEARFDFGLHALLDAAVAGKRRMVTDAPVSRPKAPKTKRRAR